MKQERVQKKVDKLINCLEWQIKWSILYRNSWEFHIKILCSNSSHIASQQSGMFLLLFLFFTCDHSWLHNEVGFFLFRPGHSVQRLFDEPVLPPVHTFHTEQQGGGEFAAFHRGKWTVFVYPKVHPLSGLKKSECSFIAVLRLNSSLWFKFVPVCPTDMVSRKDYNEFLADLLSRVSFF